MMEKYWKRISLTEKGNRMNQPLLSILIPTTPDRIEGMEELLRRLNRERMIPHMKEASDTYGSEWIAKDTFIDSNGAGVEIIIWCDNRTMTIGEKREKLYSKSTGVFSWQIDSDDLAADNAIVIILEIIKNNSDVDCITFKERCLIDGVYKRSNFSHKYDGWKDNFDGFDWVRDVFYKCVIKTEIAQKVPFPHIRYNEDQQWGIALKPFIKTEYHIDEEIYYYIHNSSPSHERYGFDKD